ncbi:RNA-binding S4 domain-containing protein [Lachnospiraceae bacterium MD335]|jgi:ribosome-associated protein|nr:ribosome-associated protein [Lachnospiraceae bacterium MD335]NDO49326.1 RNA-binding S4 domain-containing protein [Lachnospiraceae bacterium MD335]
MEEIFIRDDFIKLGQAIKLAGLVESGVEAKEVIQDGLVRVNGTVDTRRGRKLVPGDEVRFGKGSFVVQKRI